MGGYVGQMVVVTGAGVEMGMGENVEQKRLITFLGTLQDALRLIGHLPVFVG